MAYIYSLTCPKSKNIIYVGQTVIWLKYRLSQHMSDSKTNNRALYKYIRDNDIVPEIKSLEEVNSIDKLILDEVENKWISKFISEGVPLLNSQTRLDKSISIKMYRDTIGLIKKHINNTPGMTISRFFDEAVKNKLKTIYEQNAGQPIGGSPDSKAP